jgi:hypothetical protein
MGRCQALRDQVVRMPRDCRHALGLQIRALARRKAKLAPKRRALERSENGSAYLHRQWHRQKTESAGTGMLVDPA